MRVKDNIMNTRCILMTEAVTVSNLIAIASAVSEMDRQTNVSSPMLLTLSKFLLLEVFGTAHTYTHTSGMGIVLGSADFRFFFYRLSEGKK